MSAGNGEHSCNNAPEPDTRKNKGWFKKGFDQRRHLLTLSDRQRGYANAPSRIKSRLRMLYKKGRIKKTGETVWNEYADCEF